MSNREKEELELKIYKDITARQYPDNYECRDAFIQGCYSRASNSFQTLLEDYANQSYLKILKERWGMFTKDQIRQKIDFYKTVTCRNLEDEQINMSTIQDLLTVLEHQLYKQ